MKEIVLLLAEGDRLQRRPHRSGVDVGQPQIEHLSQRSVALFGSELEVQGLWS